MAASPETVSMAMFCDFENVALGVRDARYAKFDIDKVLASSEIAALEAAQSHAA